MFDERILEKFKLPEGMIVKKLDGCSEFSPSVLAVVDSPNSNIPARGYILSRIKGDIEIIYKSFDKAIEYFVKRIELMPKNDEIYLLGFISGRILYKDGKIKDVEKDIFTYPFWYSNNGAPKRVKTEPYIIKDWTRQCWQMTQGGDHESILGDEEFHRRKILEEEGIEHADKALKRYIEEFPVLRGLQYIGNL